MPRITISYRRSDSAGITGRIYDRLTTHFGDGSVFMDVDTIPFGVDFRKYVGDALQRTDFLLVVIGSQWLGPRIDGGNRIDDGNDPVRVEIAAGLRNGVTTVIPLLIDGAPMPTVAMLPKELRPLSNRNAAEISSGRDFTAHITRVIRFIDESVKHRVDDQQIESTLPSIPSDGQTVTPPEKVLRGPDGAGIVAHRRLPARAAYALLVVPLVAIVLAAVFAPARFKVGVVNAVPVNLGPYNFYPPPRNKPDLYPERPQPSVTGETYIPNWAFVARNDQSATVTCREWSGSTGSSLESTPTRSTRSVSRIDNSVPVKYKRASRSPGVTDKEVA